MTEAIRFEELSLCAPGEVTCSSEGLDWNGVALRSYRYSPSEAAFPELRDYLLIAYDGDARVDRYVDGAWSSEWLKKGDISIQTRAKRSRWRWSSEIDVTHLYLSGDALRRTSEVLFDRDVDDVSLVDALRIDDPILTAGIRSLRDEARRGGIGSGHFVDAITTQVCIQILRHYSSPVFRDQSAQAGLSKRQAQTVSDYIEANLSQPVLVDDIASIIGMSCSHFQRQFKKRFGCSPHAYIIQRRLLHATRLLSKTDVPIKTIAVNCGFSDQSHMTRMFQCHLQTTPSSLRLHRRDAAPAAPVRA